MELNQIADMNGVAINYLQKGENQKAASILLAALRMLPTCMDPLDSNYGAGQDDEVSMMLLLSNSWYDQPSSSSCGIDIAETEMSEYDVPNLNAESLFVSCNSSSAFPNEPQIGHNLHGEIYDRLFLFNNSNVPPKAVDTAAVLTYNVALLLHRDGIKSGQTVALVKALQLYRHSLKLLGHAADHLSFENLHFTAKLILTTALFWNIVNIQNMMLMQTTSNTDYFDLVGRLNELVFLMECGEHQQSKINYQLSFEFFQSSVCYLNLEAISAAPAA